MNMSQNTARSDWSERASRRTALLESWYYPILCAIGFAILLAASITPRVGKHPWRDLLMRVGSIAVIAPSLGGLVAGYVVRYYLLRRRRQKEQQ